MPLRTIMLLGVVISLLLGLSVGRVEPVSAAVVQNTTVPLNAIRSQDCTGGLVQLEGTIHLVALLEGEGTVAGHLNYQRVTATELTSGTVYRASSVDNFRVDLGGSFPADVTSVRNIHLAGPGGGGNLTVQIVVHLTVTANGDVTAVVESFSSSCR